MQHPGPDRLNGVSNSGWRRQPSPDVAVDELLDAAALAFRDLGVGKATMVDVCRYAGCSRATLYRYFRSQRELHLAFVQRATMRIAADMAAARAGTPASPEAELTERILGGIDAVRNDPLLSVWYQPDNVHVPLELTQDPEALSLVSAGLFTDASPGELDDTERERRAEWLLRSIASLLARPARDAATERALVEDFVVPVVIASARPSRPGTA